MQRARLHWESGLKLCTADCADCFFSSHTECPEHTQPRRGHSAACRHRPPHMSLVTLIASHVLQHVQPSRPHNSCFARFSLFLPYSNSARLLRLLCPASLAMDLQRMVAENQNNPAFLQEIIRFSRAVALRCGVGASRGRIQRTGSIQHRPPRFFRAACCTDPRAGIRNSGTQVQGKTSQFAPPTPPRAPRGLHPRTCA